MKRYRIVVLVPVVALLLVLHFFRPPQGGLWMRTFFDSLHVPVFGLVAVGLFVLVPVRFSMQRRVLLAFAATCVLGVLSEVAQIFTARDASVSDLWSDVLGAAGFLLALVALSPSTPVSVARRAGILVLALIVTGWPLLPLGQVSAAYLERDARFPVLVTFSAASIDTFIRRQNASLAIVDVAGSDRPVGNISFDRGPWPGVAFHDLHRDWRNYSTLEIDIMVPEGDPLNLNVRVHDIAHQQESGPYSDRFNRAYTLPAGRQVIEIALAEIERAPRNREMDMSQVTELILFGRAEDAGRSFYLREIRLR